MISGTDIFFVLNDNADQSALTVVYNFLHGILKLHLTFFANRGDFCTDSILYKLLDGFAKNICLPDTFASFPAFSNILDQILCLLLCSYNRQMCIRDRL